MEHSGLFYKKRYTKKWYCVFCRKNIEEPGVRKLKRIHYGPRHNYKPKMYYCPTCGGAVRAYAQANQVEPEVSGVTRLKSRCHRGTS